MSRLLCIPGEIVLTNNTECISTSGYNFVVKDHMIPCIPLPVLLFLHSLFEKGLSYSALNTVHSAVSNIDINSSGDPDHTLVGKHFLVCRYLKGVFNKLKPMPKYNNIWSADIVLDYLSLYWPSDKITLKELTLKLVNCIDYTLTDHLNQDRPGKVFGNVQVSC